MLVVWCIDFTPQVLKDEDVIVHIINSEDEMYLATLDSIDRVYYLRIVVERFVVFRTWFNNSRQFQTAMPEVKVGNVGVNLIMCCTVVELKIKKVVRGKSEM